MGQATVAATTVTDSDEDERVHEWEDGLPNTADITPLTQGLIPLQLLTAFNIRPEPHRTSGDVTRASQDTITSIRGNQGGHSFKPFSSTVGAAFHGGGYGGDEDEGLVEDGGKGRRRNVSPEDADSAAAAAVEGVVEELEVTGEAEAEGVEGEEGGKAVKRPRLVWTPQLHKRFVDVVAHLGIKNAVPKTIMQLMNVEGLTRENVASHLQKYRLYLKRMQGVSLDGGVGPSSSNNNNSNNNNNNSNASGNDNGNSNGSSRSGNGNANGAGSGGGDAPVNYGGHMMPVPVPMPMPMMGYHQHQNHYNYYYNHHYGTNGNQHQQQQQGMQYGNGMMMMPMQQQTGSGNNGSSNNGNSKYSGGGNGGMMSYHHHSHLHHHQHPPHVGHNDK